MKICIVAKFFYAERIGGAEVQAWLLAQELARRGHAVTYVCESLTGRGGQTETIDRVEVHWIKPIPHLNLLTLPRYGRALRTVRPDLVVHRIASGYESVIGRVCRRLSARFVWICTDDSTPVRGYFVSRQRAVLRQHPRPLYKRVILLTHAWLKDRSREYGMALVTHPCVQNTAQRALFHKQFGRDSFRFPSGHDIPAVVPAKDDPPIVLWVAGFSAGKRPEIFADLVSHCAEIGARFVMISKKVPKEPHIPPEEIRRRSGGHDNFDWLIDLPLDEALRWFDRAAVFVNTSSSANEGFPNTFVQAWSRGVPVVSFDVDPDGILDREALGRKVGSCDEARAAISGFLADPNLSQLRDRLQAFARARYSIEGVADHLLDLIDRDSPNESDWPADPEFSKTVGAEEARPSLAR